MAAMRPTMESEMSKELWAIRITSNTNELMPEYKPGMYLVMCDGNEFSPYTLKPSSIPELWPTKHDAVTTWDRLTYFGIEVEFVRFTESK